MTDSNRSISAELVKVYREAVYVIYGNEGDIVLSVGEVNPELALLLKAYGVSSAAFLTAFNPHSILLSSQENTCNQNALLADIQAHDLQCIAGEGRDPLNRWPNEPSYLVLGISQEDAERLADRYQQNAFVWMSGDQALGTLHLRYPIEEVMNGP